MRGLALILAATMALASAARATDVRLVADLGKGGSSSSRVPLPYGFAATGNRTTFFLESDRAGTELWATDGTWKGTRVIANPSLGTWAATVLGAVGARTLFSTASGLWATDGTTVGTTYLTDLPGAASPQAFLSDGRDAFFVVATTDRLAQLWRTDGSRQGTALVAALGEAGRFQSIARAGTQVVVLLEEGDLWISDGRREGTRRVWTFDRVSSAMVPLGQAVLFVAVESTDYGEDTELWRSDGTPGGTLPLTALGGSGTRLGPLGHLVRVGSTVFFAALDWEHGQELWRSDGTKAGTQRVSNFPYAEALKEWGTDSVLPAGDRLLFRAFTDPLKSHYWVVADTSRTRPRPFDTCAITCDLEIQRGFDLGKRIVFEGRSASNRALYSTDGTKAGTQRLLELAVDRSVSFAAAPGVLAISSATGDQGEQSLWLSDGTPAGTRLVRKTAGTVQFTFGAAAGRWWLGFANQLWKASADSGLARPVRQKLVTWSTGRSTFEWIGFNEHGLFLCRGERLVYATWYGEVRALAGYVPGCRRDNLQVVQGELYFVWNGEAWRSDGTTAGTRRVAQLEDANSLAGVLRLAGHAIAAFYNSSGTYRFVRLDDPTQEFLTWPDEIDRVHQLGSELVLCSPEGVFVVESVERPPRRVAASDFCGYFDRWKPLLHHDDTLLATDGNSIFRSVLPQGSESIEGLGQGDLEGSAARDKTLFVVKERFPERGLAVHAIREGARESQLLATIPGARWPWQGVVVALLQETKVLFRSVNESAVAELWSVDTESGEAVRLQSVPVGVSSEQTWEPLLASAGTVAFFPGFDEQHGVEPWQTDGTIEGTALARDLVPGPLPSAPGSFFEGDGEIFFRAEDGIHGRQPWVARP